MLKTGDKVKIVKGVSKSEKIYVVVSEPYEICGSTLVKIENEAIRIPYDITFLEKVGD